MGQTSFMPDHMEAAECITQFIMDKASHSKTTNMLRVFSLPLLVLNLYNWQCPAL